jgi:hypothetical protein
MSQRPTAAGTCEFGSKIQHPNIITVTDQTLDVPTLLAQSGNPSIGESNDGWIPECDFVGLRIDRRNPGQLRPGVRRNIVKPKRRAHRER